MNFEHFRNKDQLLRNEMRSKYTNLFQVYNNRTEVKFANNGIQIDLIMLPFRNFFRLTLELIDNTSAFQRVE
jgi:hypothetical protein